jgi:hypothetical protein
MTTLAQSDAPCRVLGGVDTHKDVHVAAVIDDVGRILATASFPTTRPGYRQLFVWLRGFGEIVAVGVEGCGSWGAGLARALTARGVRGVEVNRPNRQNRRRRGKSDTVDAEAAQPHEQLSIAGPRRRKRRRAQNPAHVVDPRRDMNILVGIDTTQNSARCIRLRHRGHATPSNSRIGWHAPPGGRTGQ